MPPASILQLFLILAHKAFYDNISRAPGAGGGAA